MVDDEARIGARMEAHMADPEWQASMRRSLQDIRAGRVLPWQVLYLPRWISAPLFKVAPWLPWGRLARRGFYDNAERAKRR